VSDEEILNAVKTLLGYEGVVAEPAGAAALAAAMRIRDRLRGRKIVVMVTGGNIDPELLESLIHRDGS